MNKLLVVALAALASAGCGVDHNSTCVAGASQACACTSGASGAQLCGSDGTFGTCVCDGTHTGPGNPGSSFRYSLGSDVQRTNWSAGTTPYQIAESLCQSLFLSNGIYGESSSDINGSYVTSLGTDCTQLRSSGPGSTSSSSTAWGAGGTTHTNSSCPAGSVAIGVAYGGGHQGFTGIGALCADFASWADPSASAPPTLSGQVIGDASNLSFQLTCAQGYALTGLEGFQYDGNDNGQITTFRGVCTYIDRVAQ